jgi:hypothetical protein
MAIQCLYQAINIDSSNGQAYYQMALLLDKKGDLSYAQNWMKAAANKGIAEAKTYLEQN